MFLKQLYYVGSLYFQGTFMSDCFKFGLDRVLFSKKKPGLLHTCHVHHNGFYMYLKPACYETCDGDWLTEK